MVKVYGQGSATLVSFASCYFVLVPSALAIKSGVPVKFLSVNTVNHLEKKSINFIVEKTFFINILVLFLQ